MGNPVGSGGVELVVVEGKHAGERVPLPLKVFLIGRDRECHLRIASGLVSKKHCGLAPTPTGLRVCDLNSRNGTFLNEQRVTGSQRLADGDTLGVGPVRFRVVIPDGASLNCDFWHPDWAWLRGNGHGAQAVDPSAETVLLGGDSCRCREEGHAGGEVEIVGGEHWHRLLHNGHSARG